MARFGTGIAALALCLGGCGARTGNEAGGGNNAAANAALPPGNGLAAGNTAAPAGPCPYRNRNWRAVVERAGTPPELRIALTGEEWNDNSGSPMVSTADSPPPVIFLDMDRGEPLPPAPVPDGMQPAPPAWGQSTYYYAYRGHTTAVIRCNGREVARVPIPAPR